MCNVLTVPTVWYSTLSGTVKIPHSRNSKNIPHSLGPLKYHTVGRVRTFHIVGDWYYNCPRQRGMFLLFRQFNILTVTDNVEYSYCSYSVVL
jgi:hypothetical protein